MSEQRGTTATVDDGRFERDTNYLSDRILDDPQARWPVEPSRYRLVVARACPWANRAVIVRRLLGLEDALPMGIAAPTHDWRSWKFDLDPGEVDPVLGIHRLREAFEAREPGYDRGITVPAIVDVPSGQVVTNDFRQITVDLSTQWRAHHRSGAPDLYPEHRRDEIEGVAELVYRDVNNGVYEAGFAGSQAAYEDAYQRLFDRLDWLSDRLADQRYLVGDHITEADIRLFTTLARFDASTTTTSAATDRSWRSCRSCGPTPATCSRPPDSATPPTSCRSSSTTTSCTPASTPRGSCRRAPTCTDGRSPTAARNSAALPSGRARPRRRRRRTSACPPSTTRPCARWPHQPWGEWPTPPTHSSGLTTSIALGVGALLTGTPTHRAPRCQAARS
nr:glutathione S-transferase C-terminal domain-containing protein [Egibacter rhizosphaerae]